MLGDRDVAATVAVRDAAAARAFYEGVLGLSVMSADEDSGVATYRCGAATLVVYRSETGGRTRPPPPPGAWARTSRR
jgi:catechol 2,3-dioxygenase-like lactoylglutathione lyase family enzyme